MLPSAAVSLPDLCSWSPVDIADASGAGPLRLKCRVSLSEPAPGSAPVACSVSSDILSFDEKAKVLASETYAISREPAAIGRTGRPSAPRIEQFVAVPLVVQDHC